MTDPLRTSFFPPPPPDKFGWPWETEPQPLPLTLPNGSPWPKISIVTPSFNQGQYLEETIRSVLLQGYPNLEYIIIDGGSTDNSVEIIKKYEPWLTYWVSEPDRGQSHAINKGFSISTGEIMAWINSDDLLYKGSLVSAALKFRPSHQPDLYLGIRRYVDAFSKVTKLIKPFPGQSNINFIAFGISPGIFQESSFWNRAAWEQCGPLAEELFGAFDLDFFCRVLSSPKHDVINCPDYIGGFRKWGQTKCETKIDLIVLEGNNIRKEYKRPQTFLRYRWVRLSIVTLCDIYRRFTGSIMKVNFTFNGK